MDTDDLIRDDLWQLLRKIKLAFALPPTVSSSRGFDIDEEDDAFEVEIQNFTEKKLLRHLHDQEVIEIVHPMGTFGLLDPEWRHERTPFIAHIKPGYKFDETYKQYERLLSKSEKVVMHLNKRGNKLIIETPSGNFLVYTFKTGSPPAKIFDYLMNNECAILKYSKVKLEADCPDYNVSPSEMARLSGFTKELKDYFIPIRSKSEVMLRKSIEIGLDEVDTLTKSLRPV